jgi:multidrug efflux pump subunit AcrA (membrane-fusion protein)
MISRRLAALGVVVALAGCSEPAPPVEAPPTEVGTIEARSRPVALALEYPAWMRGALEVEVRARVSGILLERLYEEGAPVGKGALLFRIDPAPFPTGAPSS